MPVGGTGGSPQVHQEAQHASQQIGRSSARPEAVNNPFNQREKGDFAVAQNQGDLYFRHGAQRATPPQ